jgi:hypothetical protein
MYSRTCTIHSGVQTHHHDTTMRPLLEHIFSRLYRPNNNDTTVVRIKRHSNYNYPNPNPNLNHGDLTPPSKLTQTLETNPAIQAQPRPWSLILIMDTNHANHNIPGTQPPT